MCFGNKVMGHVDLTDWPVMVRFEFKNEFLGANFYDLSGFASELCGNVGDGLIQAAA